MADEQKEVNTDVDKVELEPSPDEEGEEVITKLEDIEEKETPSDESSTEKEPSETTEEEEGEETEEGEEKEKLITQIRKEEKPSESEEDKGFVEPPGGKTDDEIKRLSNETPREYALRLEVTRLKRGNRDKRTKELLGEGKPEKPSELSKSQHEQLSEEEKTLLGQYDPQELGTFEKILNVLAKKYGWVKREELASTTRSQVSNDILNGFLETHPEYLPENDNDNVLWNRFKSEFQLYKTPENPRDLKRVFSKIHRDIFGVNSKPESEFKKIDAQKEKLKVVSHSGGSAAKGQSSSKEARLTPEQKNHLKGFTDQELLEL